MLRTKMQKNVLQKRLIKFQIDLRRKKITEIRRTLLCKKL